MAAEAAEAACLASGESSDRLIDSLPRTLRCADPRSPALIL
jgi:hypothetical protein